MLNESGFYISRLENGKLIFSDVNLWRSVDSEIWKSCDMENSISLLEKIIAKRKESDFSEIHVNQKTYFALLFQLTLHHQEPFQFGGIGAKELIVDNTLKDGELLFS